LCRYSVWLDFNCPAQLVKARPEDIQVLFHSVGRLGGELQDLHAWAYRLDVAVRGMPVELNRLRQVKFSKADPDQPYFEMGPHQQANGRSTKAKQTGSDSAYKRCGSFSVECG
jgi:hypothetical protein